MARSSKLESIEKFRYKVYIFTAFGAESNFKDVKLVGFSEVIPPKASIKIIEYRENIDMNRTTKQPGLVSYEPVILRKGVTISQDLYNWYKEVHNDVYDLYSGNEIAAANNLVPTYNPKFRREIIISALDREGEGVKHWLCVNCFPISYKGGDSLNAKENEKLIEELTITYEAFIELVGKDLNSAIQDAFRQSEEAFKDALIAATVGAALGAAANLF